MYKKTGYFFIKTSILDRTNIMKFIVINKFDEITCQMFTSGKLVEMYGSVRNLVVSSAY